MVIDSSQTWIMHQNNWQQIKYSGIVIQIFIIHVLVDDVEFPLLEIFTHWGQDQMDAISQTTFSSAFSWMKMFEFQLKFHWSLFLRFQLTIFQHWFRKWLGADQATSHYLNQWWLVYWCIYASLGLNELMAWPEAAVIILFNLICCPP